MKLVNLSLSKSLQKLGYDESCMDYYLHGKLNGIEKTGYAYPFSLWEDFNAIGRDDLRTDLYSAPRLDDAAYWIRNKFKLSIEVYVDYKGEWVGEVKTMASNLLYSKKDVKNYEKALEFALTGAIKILEKGS